MYWKCLISISSTFPEMKIVLTELEQRIKNTLQQVSKQINSQNPNCPPVILRIAGGWVRDKLLGLESNDIDIAINTMNGEPFAIKVKEFLKSDMSNVSKIQVNPEKSKHLETATARVFGLDVDFVNLRAEVYQSDSRNPTVSFGTPLQDAMRRDITINALFYNLDTEEVEDFTGRGILDLVDKRIRTPLPPRQTFLDDPLRVLRVIRFATRFGYKIETDIMEAARDIELLDAFERKLSRERVGVEIEKMFKGEQPGAALRYIVDFGIYNHVFKAPENIIPDGCPVDVLDCLESILDIDWLRSKLSAANLAHLYLACALSPYRGLSFKVKKKDDSAIRFIVLNSLKLSTNQAEICEALVNQSFKIVDAVEKYKDLSRKEIGLFIREVGSKLGKDWELAFLLSLAIQISLHPLEREAISKAFKAFVDGVYAMRLEHSYALKSILDGKEVALLLNIKPGKQVGEILQRLIEYQLSKESVTREEAELWLLNSIK